MVCSRSSPEHRDGPVSPATKRMSALALDNRKPWLVGPVTQQCIYVCRIELHSTISKRDGTPSTSTQAARGVLEADPHPFSENTAAPPWRELERAGLLDEISVIVNIQHVSMGAIV